MEMLKKLGVFIIEELKREGEIALKTGIYE